MFILLYLIMLTILLSLSYLVSSCISIRILIRNTCILYCLILIHQHMICRNRLLQRLILLALLSLILEVAYIILMSFAMSLIQHWRTIRFMSYFDFFDLMRNLLRLLYFRLLLIKHKYQQLQLLVKGNFFDGCSNNLVILKLHP